MRTRTLIGIGLVLAIPALASARWFRFGPPTLCFPVDIGSAKTLPQEREDLPEDVSLEAATVAVLDQSDDALVHMETLRRASLLIKGDQEAARLLDRLKDRVLIAEAADAEPRARALAWFDVGYCLRNDEQSQRRFALDASPFIAKSTRIVADDAALQFGAAVGSFDVHGGMHLYFAHVAAAQRLAPADSLVGKNLAATVKWFTPELLDGGYHDIARRADEARAKVAPRERDF